MTESVGGCWEKKKRGNKRARNWLRKENKWLSNWECERSRNRECMIRWEPQCHLKLVFVENSGYKMRLHKVNTDLRGLRSMQTFSKMSLRNCGVLSCTTWWTLRRDFRYSMKRLMKPTKCSAVRMVPGTASGRDKERAVFKQHLQTFWRPSLLFLS